ncbi:MAG: CDP-alcohol phosphatidyltransferase family protein [Burkholderiales bacterium]|nr:CDP-alcohol phosphatidyltransferase family protein [Opitutaceae bacterium]
MARAGCSPNGVSVLGVFVAAAGACAMFARWWWVAAVCVQLRLLCNMLDGMIAVEHGKGDKLGAFFNEVPDRVADVMLLLAAGFAVGETSDGQGLDFWGPTLGWAAALLAVGTAYLRQAGGAMGLEQDFCGPLAKPQRMFVLTVALLAAGAVELVGGEVDASGVVRGGLWIIVVGTAVTLARRTERLMEALRRR